MTGPYRDNLQFLTQTNGDGGDTLHKTGVWGFLQAFLGGEFAKYLADFVRLYPNKTFLRHPMFPWNDRYDVGRDQILPNWVAIATFLLKQDSSGAGVVLQEQYDRFKGALTYPNMRDFVGSEFECIFHRALDLPKRWLWFHDLSLIIMSLVRCGYLPHWSHDLQKFVWYDSSDVSDDITHSMMLKFTTVFSPTWASRFAMFLYRKLKPKAGYVYSTEKDHVLQCWEWYFRLDSGGSLEYYETFRMVWA